MIGRTSFAHQGIVNAVPLHCECSWHGVLLPPIADKFTLAPLRSGKDG
ncbi:MULTISPECIES: hypothetical protein [Geobacillus]|nr:MULTISPECIES: hypothetical protein [Geobacillus]MED3906121.1 hypothetical protein [Geobacillus thermodenitrificans]QNU31234.1 hypothetical protein IC804_18045 [Geobacillus sp. 47C-IIb]